MSGAVGNGFAMATEYPIHLIVQRDEGNFAPFSNPDATLNALW